MEKPETSEFWASVARIAAEQRKVPKAIRDLADVPNRPFRAELLRDYQRVQRASKKLADKIREDPDLRARVKEALAKGRERLTATRRKRP